MPIKCYGLHWNPNLPMVGVGIAARSAGAVNVSRQLGIYVVYDGAKIVYVGKSAEGRSAGIGGRLYAHWVEEGWRWSSHSWFGFRTVEPDGSLGPADPIDRSMAGTIADIEALLINLVDPAWNCALGAHRHLEEFVQVTDA